MNLNRKQLSLLITFFTMSIVVLMAFNLHLSNQEEDEYVIEMAMLDDETLEELLEEKKELEKELAELDPIKSHTAFNEAVKQSVAEPEPLKSLEELLEERTTNNDQPLLTSDGGYAANLKELAEKRKEQKELVEAKDAEKKEFTNLLKDKRTSITYSLVERSHYELPPPIYTCEEGGKVVINIKVDADGNVFDAQFNANSSNTSDFCLVENAKTYALKSKFTTSNRSSQLGTITYLYQSK